MDKILENNTDYRLFGTGVLYDYGTYDLAVANNINSAYEILAKTTYERWKKWIYECKERAIYDDNGKPLNGYADDDIEIREIGLYEMNEEQLFDFYRENNFTIEDVEDLETNTWRGEWA